MAKWFGNIGYAVDIEDPEGSGIYKKTWTIRQYQGDVIRNYKRTDQGNDVNDGITISNELSILADPYAYENFHTMQYVEYMGARWKVIGVDAATRPRLVLTLGGVYNGETGPTDET